MDQPMENEWNELEDLIARDPAARAASMGMDVSTLALLARLREMDPFGRPEYGDSDIGNARIFAAFCSDTLCWVTERKSWFAYENGVWHKDECALRAMSMCKRLVGLLHHLAAEAPEALQQTIRKRVMRLTRRGVRETLLRDAQDLLAQSISGFDQKPWLMNCENGTIDLHTGALRPHDPADLLTVMANVRYDPKAVFPRWNAFIEQIMSRMPEEQTAITGDETREKAQYLQKVMGYCLTGDTSRECMFMLYGPTTRNGKGVLMETIARMLGGYARAARPETLALGAQASGSAPNEDVARLRGARFVSISEPDYGQKLNVALIKRITGSDTITARFLHENSFEYRPEFKVIVSTNHLLAVNDHTLFSSGRLKLITFERHFDEAAQDKGLKQLFASPEALSAVLNWCLEGLRLLKQDGLRMPGFMCGAVQSYERDVDLVAQFMEERLAECPGAKTRFSDVYASYQAWCLRNGYQCENARVFCNLLGRKAVLKRARPESGAHAVLVLANWKLA